MKIVKEQLKNKYFLIIFEDLSCSVVSAKSNSICMEMRERLLIKVRTLFYFSFLVIFKMQEKNF